MPERKSADIEQMLVECPALEFIIDGTERPIQRPKDKLRQKRYYSGKKKRHTVKNLVISDKNTKKIKVLSRTYDGKKHDKTLVEEESYLFPPAARTKTPVSKAINPQASLSISLRKNQEEANSLRRRNSKTKPSLKNV